MDLTGFNPPGAWVERAECGEYAADSAGIPHRPELWQSTDEEDRQQAVLICMGCPVRSECLNYALDTREREGVWGGFTEDERRRMLHLRRWPKAENPPPHGTAARSRWDRRRGVTPCHACLEADALRGRINEEKRAKRGQEVAV